MGVASTLTLKPAVLKPRKLNTTHVTYTTS